MIRIQSTDSTRTVFVWLGFTATSSVHAGIVCSVVVCLSVDQNAGDGKPYTHTQVIAYHSYTHILGFIAHTTTRSAPLLIHSYTHVLLRLHTHMFMHKHTHTLLQSCTNGNTNLVIEVQTDRRSYDFMSNSRSVSTSGKKLLKDIQHLRILLPKNIVLN